MVALVVILAAAAAFAVWLFGNLVYAAILVNPIPFLDFLLLGASSAVLVTLLLTAWFFPFAGPCAEPGPHRNLD
ncbi:MAG: hypothetical protein H6509_16180 [Bryobacterales bacterium]|nr:hypothetical protein [Bryobacterales bacterium]